MKDTPYNAGYFESHFFQQDYRTIARSILDVYQPKTVAELGCGNGKLSRELATLGVEVFAVDGFSCPDFAGLPVVFQRVDLNNTDELESCFAGRRFDLAICLEVAEHLESENSEGLIRCLTEVASVIVFSAAVPGQGGSGHINCQRYLG